MDDSRNRGLITQAEALLELGRPQEALQVAGMAALAQPTDATVHCVMATGHLAVGDVREAFSEIKRAFALEPTWEWPHRLHAMALLRQSEPLTGRRAKRLQKKAAVAARQAARLGPIIPEAHCLLGFAELTLGRIEAARAAVGRALELRPDDAPAWVVASLVEVSSQRWASAAHAAHRALLLSPGDEAAITVLEVARHQLGGAFVPAA